MLVCYCGVVNLFSSKTNYFCDTIVWIDAVQWEMMKFHGHHFQSIAIATINRFVSVSIPKNVYQMIIYKCTNFGAFIKKCTTGLIWYAAPCRCTIYFRREFIPAVESLWSTVARFCRCSWSVLSVTNNKQIPDKPWGIFSRVHWKIDGVADTPNGRQLYWKRLLCVLIAMILLVCSSNWICWYQWYALAISSFENVFPPVSDAIKVIKFYVRGSYPAWFTVSL